MPGQAGAAEKDVIRGVKVHRRPCKGGWVVMFAVGNSSVKGFAIFATSEVLSFATISKLWFQF